MKSVEEYENFAIECKKNYSQQESRVWFAERLRYISIRNSFGILRCCNTIFSGAN